MVLLNIPKLPYLKCNIRGKAHWFLIPASSPVSLKSAMIFEPDPQYKSQCTGQVGVHWKFCFTEEGIYFDLGLPKSRTSASKNKVHRFSFPNIVRCIDFVSQTSSGASMLFPKQPQVHIGAPFLGQTAQCSDSVDNVSDDHTSHSLCPLTSNIDSLTSNVTVFQQYSTNWFDCLFGLGICNPRIPPIKIHKGHNC